MENKFELKLKQMHPGVADMDAKYTFYCEYNDKIIENSWDAMILLKTDCSEVKVNGLDVIVPYSFRQAGRTVKVTAILNDYMTKTEGLTADYVLTFSTAFSDEPTLFDDFDGPLNTDIWTEGEESWEYKGAQPGRIENSDYVMNIDKDKRLNMLTTAKSFQQTFGCFSANMKFPEYKNTSCTCNCAFWLCSNVLKPEEIMFKRNPDFNEKFGRIHAGEIDIVEYSPTFGDHFAGTIHWHGWTNGIHRQSGDTSLAAPKIREGYHVISLIWEPGVLYWYFDGELVRTYKGEGIETAGQEFGADMVVLLQMGYHKPAPDKYQGNWIGRTFEEDLPLEFRTDWVKVHALKK